MDTTLIVMAAGMASRYGGNKQIAGMGPNNEILLEYSVCDAIRAGFNKVVFIIRPEMLSDMKRICGDKLAKKIRVEYAFQDYSSLPAWYAVPEGRVKPFGTVHAALCARDAVDEPFAIINADDYYGVSAFQTIYDKLVTLPPKGKGAMVGYQLKNTVSEHGTVSRGVCQAVGGDLKKVTERLKIRKYPDGRIADTADPDAPVPLDPESIVSMNFWGFTPWIFEEMAVYFAEFLRGLAPDAIKAECLLPVLVDKLITEGKLDVAVLHSDAVWFGVTYREDRPIVAEALAALHAQGDYPATLKG